MVFDFGIRLRELRRRKKMTQAQVAKRLNLSKTAVSGYENNTKTPSVDVLIQLSILYGVTTDYLLGLDNREMLYVGELGGRQRELLEMLVSEMRGKIGRRQKNDAGNSCNTRTGAL